MKSDTDATELMAELLLLGDVKSDTDATELMAELSLEAGAGAPTADDPFTPALVADAWRHLGACDQCSSRRRALLTELAPAISAGTADATTTSTLDARVRAAVAELVPNTAAVPESLARPAPSRRRRFAGPGGFGFGSASGSGGAIPRPWIVGIAGAALLVAVGAAFALRPRSTEQSAVGTVPPRVERAARSDTTSLTTSVVAETEAAAANDAAIAGEVEDGPAPSTAAIGGAARAVSADPSFEELTPTPAPEAATGRDASPAEESIPAGASSKTTAASAPAVPAQAATSVPAQAARKKASLPAPAASAAVAAAPTAASEPQTATADLGTFADAASALDRFAARVATPLDVTAGQLESQPASGSANASNTASPAVAPLPAAAPSAEPLRCPAITGSPRLSARIGDRVVLVVRTATADPTATADVVLDAATCVELARRTNPAATSAPVGG